MILLWTLFFGKKKEKSVKRALFDRALRYLLDRLNVRQLQSLFGTTRATYEKWAKKAGVEPVIEDIGEDAKLFWIGDRCLDKVVLYFHGQYFRLLTNYASWLSVSCLALSDVLKPSRFICFLTCLRSEF